MAIVWRERDPANPVLPGALFTACLLVLMLTVLAGCNTTRGIGQDVQAAGDVIQDTAEEAEEELED